MNDAKEFLIPDQRLHKIDTLSAVFSNRAEVETLIFAIEMGDGLVEELVEKLSEREELKKINFNHPFGHYEIPVITTDFLSGLNVPCEVKVVPRDHPAFADRDNPDATYDPHNDIVYLGESDFTLVGRLLGWIGLGRDSNIMNEEMAEHEVRHALFKKSLLGPLGGGIGSIDEGFARATRFASFLDDSGKAFETHMTYQAYEKYHKDPKEIAEYVELFKAMQAGGVDEVEMLKIMEDNEWWANRYDVWHLDSGVVGANIMQHINSDDDIENLSKIEHSRRRSELLDFRYGVWKMVFSYLEEIGCAPKVNWEDAVKEEKIVREGWDQFRREKKQDLQK